MSLSQSLLSQIASLVTLDVDSMDPSVLLRHRTSFCEMTSNQAIVYLEAMKPDNHPLVEAALKYVDNDDDGKVDEAIDVLTVLLAKRILPSLSGNVHVQTSPIYAYDTAKTVEHAKRLVHLFDENNVPRNRVCIKIPITPESVLACAELTACGIQTLGTCLFSVPQAEAASQAGCLFVAPYFNELRVHFDRNVWQDYQNPGVEHPMVPVVHSILEVFRQTKTKTKIMPASIVTAKEVVGLVALRPHHLTLSAAVLDELALLPKASFHDSAIRSCQSTYQIGRDLLANNAGLLRKALIEDCETCRKIEDALVLFAKCEEKTKDLLKLEVG